MHRFTSIATAGVALTLAAGLASATEHPAETTAHGDRCALVPREQFRPEADLTPMLERLGYQALRIGTNGGCYSVRAVDRRGKHFDIKFEGVNLRMVSRYFARTEAEVVAQR